MTCLEVTELTGSTYFLSPNPVHVQYSMMKRHPFHQRRVEYKSSKSRDTWSNRQIWPWSTKQSRANTNRVLPRERTGHSKCPLPTTQEKTLHMDITRWSILKSDWLCSLQAKVEKLYKVNKNKPGKWLWLSTFSRQNSMSLCPVSFCTPRPNLPVTPRISWLPIFAF